MNKPIKNYKELLARKKMLEELVATELEIVGYDTIAFTRQLKPARAVLSWFVKRKGATPGPVVEHSIGDIIERRLIDHITARRPGAKQLVHYLLQLALPKN